MFRILILMLTILILLLFNYVYFHLTDNQNIKFLSKNKLCILFSNQHKYFKKFNKKNIRARFIETNNIINYYCQGCLNFKINEKNKIIEIIHSLKEKYIYNCLNEWKFGKVNDTIELGLPHTHNDVIIFSENVINSLSKSKRTFHLLIHEKTHILQRKYNKIFNILYSDYWNFFQGKIVSEIDYEIRLNPDGINNNWIFNYKNNYIWPLAIINTILNDSKYIAVYLKRKGNIFYAYKTSKVLDLNKCPEYLDFFGNQTSNYYHPNEISAEMLSDYILNKSDVSLANKKFRVWLKKYKVLDKN